VRHLVHFFACLLLLATSGASTALYAQSPLENAQLQPLLLELSEVKLSQTRDVLEQLELQGGPEILPLFTVMLAGNLYARESDETLYEMVRNPDGDYLARPIFSEETAEIVDNDDFEKIRVNNAIRTYLRTAIARIMLNSDDSGQRFDAVKTIQGDLDEDSIELLQARQAVEQDSEVMDALEEAIALYQLGYSDDDDIRIASLTRLSGSLDSDVRNEIQKILKTDDQGHYLESNAELVAAAETSLQAIQSKVEFYGIIEQLFFGLSLGSIYLLAAIGLSITFGVMGVINMAHGEMMMIGAYTTYVVQLLMPNFIEYSIWVAIPSAFIIAGLVGILIERTVIRFLHGRPLETLLATFGISLILQQAVRTIFSPLNRQVSTPEWMSGSLDINPVLSLTYNRLYILVFALLVFFILQLVLNKTSLGLNVRAVSQNRSMAKAIGIKTEWVDAMTFGLGSGIAGVAGVALSQLTNVGPNLGQSYIIDSFMVVVFGGVGNLLGTLVGGFTLGISTKVLEPLTGAVLAKILILVFIILFIQKRPKGLFPQKGRAAND